MFHCSIINVHAAFASCISSFELSCEAVCISDSFNIIPRVFTFVNTFFQFFSGFFEKIFQPHRYKERERFYLYGYKIVRLVYTRRTAVRKMGLLPYPPIYHHLPVIETCRINTRFPSQIKAIPEYSCPIKSGVL